MIPGVAFGEARRAYMPVVIGFGGRETAEAHTGSQLAAQMSTTAFLLLLRSGLTQRHPQEFGSPLAKHRCEVRA